MIFAVLFEDNEEHASKRQQYMARHLAFLEKHGRHIQVAGPLRDAESTEPAGGLWVVEAENLTEVQSLIEEDPFWPTGLRKSIRVLEWKQVFVRGEKLV